MDMIIGEDIERMTGYKVRSHQVKWFQANGITCKVNARGEVWTTNDWLNLRDQQQEAANDDDGFNAGFMKNA